MSTSNCDTHYNEDFKLTLVNLCQSRGKTHATLCKEYEIESMTLNP